MLKYRENEVFMMETYMNFLERINKFETKELCFYENTFKPNKSLNDKFYVNKTFKNFYGDTVVFDLNVEQKI